MRATCVVFLGFLLALQGIGAANTSIPPASAEAQTGFTPQDLAVIVNDEDPLSRRVAEYYRQRRRIPEENLIHVQFNPGQSEMSRQEFQIIKNRVDLLTPPSVQAYALTWAAPYRVACMSITTAFAAGFDPAFCAKGCGGTKLDPYFDSDSRAPYTDFRIRPTMALAGKNFEDVKQLIDRGVMSDGTFPRGTGYLVSTSDVARNVRADMYPTILSSFSGKLRLKLITADDIAGRNDILFYFTGIAKVRSLQTDRFLPGAIADHLTSDGGRLTDSDQMSSLAWLEHGATGSYGTVTEPCNLADKFPSPEIVIRYYLQGQTLIEAYWKSVAMPGQGIFIGEPLAAPYRRRLN